VQHLFSYAFRPFFLLNGIFAIAVMAVWMFALYGFGPDTLPVNIVYWHGHEMLVGFAAATIAGFILTAVATWTGRPPVRGGALMLLVGCWLLGRLVMAYANVLPAALVAVVDMLFPMLLVIYVAKEVVGAGNKRNYPIVYIVAFIALFNSMFHLSLLGVLKLSSDADRVALYLLMHLVLLLISVIGGRIVPNFTANWLRSEGESRLPVAGGTVDRLTIIATLATGLFAAFLPVSGVTAVLAFAAAALHAYRLAQWRGLAARREPLLFVLHAAYAWLPIGYALLGCAILGWFVPATIALHALTMGGIAFMILAVTTRVALAHTGRKLHASRLTVLAYWALLVSVVLRLVSPYGTSYLTFVTLSAIAWGVAFALFIWVYGPILAGPRVDE
jgi:uncharacterized protein involved in response to NO